MRHHYLRLALNGTLIGLLSLAAGCQFLPFGGDDTATDPATQPVEGQQPVVDGQQPVVEGEQPIAEGQQPVAEGEQPVAEGEQPANGEEFADPDVEDTATAGGGTLPGDLIAPTNADERVQALERERSDPFSLIPVDGENPETVVVVELPPEEPEVPETPPTDLSPPPNGGNQPPPPGGNGTATPGDLAEIPELVPIPDAVPLPPPTDLARAVEVTGIAQIGGRVYAIVNAPNEPHSRYVYEGQLLSEGEVLVRRIDVSSPDPVVILVQNGVEVVTAVGGGGAVPEDVAAANGVIPVVDR